MSEEKKLHIDEDWKAQVDREKEQIRHQNSVSDTTESEEQSVQAVSQESMMRDEPAQPTEGDLPPASLVILISSLASQAMASMGQLPGEDGKPLPVSLPFARHFIDLIGVIEDKTRNNLTNDEAGFLNNTLHHLRLMFVECSRHK